MKLLKILWKIKHQDIYNIYKVPNNSYKFLHTFFIPFCVSQEWYIRIYPFYFPVLTVHLCFNDKQSHRDAPLAVSICSAWGLRSIE